MVSTTLSADNTAEVAKVFQGAEAVFAVTNFLEHADKARVCRNQWILIPS
jgi:hypothetical protein